MDARLLARLMAATRVGIGLALFAAPRTASRLWLGTDDLPGAANLLARGLGARDLVIGVGQLVALDDDETDAAPWLDAGVAADAADAAATVLTREHLDSRTVLGTLAVASGAAVAGLALKRALASQA